MKVISPLNFFMERRERERDRDRERDREAQRERERERETERHEVAEELLHFHHQMIYFM